MISSCNLVLKCIGAIITTLVWFGFYKFLRKRYKFEGEFTSRVVASAHALVVSILSLLCFLYGPNPFIEPGKGNTGLHDGTLVVSVGYFAYDMVWCLVHGTEPPIMLAHHAASLVAMFVILASGKSGAEAAVGLGSLEVTNPLLQARWFLKVSGYNHTPVHTVVEWAFVLLFIVMRLIVGTKLLITVIEAKSVDTVVQLSTVALYAISCIFLVVILRFVFRKYVLGVRTHCCDFTCDLTDHIPHNPQKSAKSKVY